MDTYASVVSEQSLRLKVCESSLPVCAAVAAGVLDSSCLSHLVLDLDISREAVWEKVGSCPSEPPPSASSVGVSPNPV